MPRQTKRQVPDRKVPEVRIQNGESVADMRDRPGHTIKLSADDWEHYLSS